MLTKEVYSAIVIGDIAGQYDALLRLVAKYPGRQIVCVGDMIDRGPKSAEVVEFFMSNEEAIAICGNHEDMMIRGLLQDCEDSYADWIFNGGTQTLNSYNNLVPKAHLNFLASLPKSVLLKIGADSFFISHAPNPELAKCFPTAATEAKIGFVWNRKMPTESPLVTAQIFGHQGVFEFDNNFYCIDNSHKEELGAILLPELDIVSEKW